jgi:glucosamine kinase
MEPLFLGVDGGGTGCRVAICDVQGHILARAEAGPANIASAPEAALGNILSASGAALAQIGGDVPMSRLQAGLGLAGANAAGAGAWLGARLPFARAEIVTDAVTAVKGALGREDGIVAAIGTGSVFAEQRTGRVRQIGGWGLALGDEGSGAVLGRALLARALRALDGAVPMSPLLEAVLKEFVTPEALVTFSLGAKAADYAAFAPRVVASDDAAARAIMAQAVEEVRGSLVALQGNAALPVTFIGGLGPVYAARITDWPQRPAAGSALDGALLLARETLP